MARITTLGGKTASHTGHGVSLSDEIELQRYLKTVSCLVRLNVAARLVAA